MCDQYAVVKISSLPPKTALTNKSCGGGGHRHAAPTSPQEGTRNLGVELSNIYPENLYVCMVEEEKYHLHTAPSYLLISLNKFS